MADPLRSRLGLRASAVVAAVGAVALLAQPTAAAATRIDPGALPRGADPAIAHLVRDTIHDGDLEVPATTRGVHEGLWVTRSGYVVRDYNVGPRRQIRVVHITRNGDRRLVARSHEWIDVAVSEDGRRLAVQRAVGRSGEQTRVTVERPRTGRVLDDRTLRLARLAAVTERRVLLGLRATWHDPATIWWDYRRDRTHRIADQAAIGADVGHDKVVLTTSSIGDFCLRVAALSRPAHTLWRSCRRAPHQWSPDGTRVLLTHTYFDAAGTDRWWVGDGRTGRPGARITGRLDWDAVWEDDGHFLTLAQGDSGLAAVIRCDLSGTCERASRLWHVPLPEDSLYYAAPPVVLAR